MARSDWRKYYVLTFRDGRCSPYFYCSLKGLRRIVEETGRGSKLNPVAGILHVKGRHATDQQRIFARVVDKPKGAPSNGRD